MGPKQPAQLTEKLQWQKRVSLIVDDDGQFRDLMKRHLKEKGFCNISVADNGEEGIMQAIAVKPDIVILDTVLPPSDGFTVCKKMVRIPGLESTKIIMTTSGSKKIETSRSKHLHAEIEGFYLHYGSYRQIK